MPLPSQRKRHAARRLTKSKNNLRPTTYSLQPAEVNDLMLGPDRQVPHITPKSSRPAIVVGQAKTPICVSSIAHISTPWMYAYIHPKWPGLRPKLAPRGMTIGRCQIQCPSAVDGKICEGREGCMAMCISKIPVRLSRKWGGVDVVLGLRGQCHRSIRIFLSRCSFVFS